MEFNNNIPIYMQVMEKIKQEIVREQLKLGDKMPSTRDYANELGINFNTVARVYKELELEEILFTKRGIGTFVTENTEKVSSIRYEMAKRLIETFLDGMNQIGYSKENMIRILESYDFNNKEGKNYGNFESKKSKQEILL